MRNISATVVTVLGILITREGAVITRTVAEELAAAVAASLGVDGGVVLEGLLVRAGLPLTFDVATERARNIVAALQ